METDMKKYFNFEWNATRKNFWMFTLFVLIISTLITAAQGVAVGPVLTFWIIVNLIFSLALIIPNIAINKARLNDAGWSGWWMLLPILNIIVMGFFPTKIEDNKYLK